jgi:hypothetical protein
MTRKVEVTIDQNFFPEDMSDKEAGEILMEMLKNEMPLPMTLVENLTVITNTPLPV